MIYITSIFTLSKTPLPLPSRPTQINKRSTPNKIIKQAGIHLIIVFFALKQSRSCIEKKITARINPTIGAVLGSLKIIIHKSYFQFWNDTYCYLRSQPCDYTSAIVIPTLLTLKALRIRFATLWIHLYNGHNEKRGQTF